MISEWTNYTPNMLKTKKKCLIKGNEKLKSAEVRNKYEMLMFKTKLLKKEAVREDERMQKEQELYNWKIANEKLLNEKLSLEIKLLRKQLLQ